MDTKCEFDAENSVHTEFSNAHQNANSLLGSRYV